MNDKDKTEITLEELASKIVSAPDNWILFWGNRVSAGYADNYMKVLSDYIEKVLCELPPDTPVSKKIQQAVQDKNISQLSGLLFGNTWDEASLLDTVGKRNIRLRKMYAEVLCDRNKTDVHDANQKLHLQELIGKFRGTILTTCQDDTVEIFWEYKHSLSADTIVYTPQFIAESSDWIRWLNATEEETIYLKSQDELSEDAVVLVKLFGSRINQPRCCSPSRI